MKNDALVGVIKCTIEGISRTKAVALSESLFYLLGYVSKSLPVGGLKIKA